MKVWGALKRWGAGWAAPSYKPRDGQSPHGMGLQLYRTCPGVVTVAVLLPQTKDVTKAMSEKKFDEALKLRGR